MPEAEDPSLPTLFPSKLLDCCLETVQRMVLMAGTRTERRAKLILERDKSEQDTDSRDYFLAHGYKYLASTPGYPSASPSSDQTHFTTSNTFLAAAKIVREFLSTFLAGPVLDSLSESARTAASPTSPGTMFSFSVFCGDRLGRLILHLHSERFSPRNRSWVNFLTSDVGARLARDSLAQCQGLNSLYVQHIATDKMLRVVADTCTRLTILDISFSREVTDIGLVHLCGPLTGAGRPSEPPPKGCKYLRELYFNPQLQPGEKQIMPQVIACLLRHLHMLQVVDLTNLHHGIDQYYRGHVRPDSRYSTLKPLNLVHYTGSDRLAEVLQICPKLRTFKLFVTESLASLGVTLQTLGHTLDQISLVFPNTTNKLSGLKEFLEACGRRVSRLDVECSHSTIITTQDLLAIANNCTQLEAISFTNFHMVPEVDLRVSHSPVPMVPADFPFLRTIKFSNVVIDDYGKDVFRYLIGGAHDLESIFVSFNEEISKGYFFSDFLLDDIFATNSLSQLQEFILKDGALTLISALRLITTLPKLRIVGRLLNWDAEPSEINSFVQILRKAKSLNLLQDITIV